MTAPRTDSAEGRRGDTTEGWPTARTARRRVIGALTLLFAAATGVGGTLLYFSATRSPDLNPRDGAGELAFYAARPHTRIGVSVSVADAQDAEPRVEAAIVGPVGARWLLVVSGVWTPVGDTATKSTPPTLMLHPHLGVFTPRSFPIGGEAFSGTIPRPASDVPRSFLPLPVIVDWKLATPVEKIGDGLIRGQLGGYLPRPQNGVAQIFGLFREHRRRASLWYASSSSAQETLSVDPLTSAAQFWQLDLAYPALARSNPHALRGTLTWSRAAQVQWQWTDPDAVDTTNNDTFLAGILLATCAAILLPALSWCANVWIARGKEDRNHG